MVNFDIDLVIPFVDNKDHIWQMTYIDYCRSHQLYDRLDALYGERFEDFGLFYYNLKLIDKNMPWIRNIYLIVSNIEQVPDYINKEKTKIILHKDIIPAKYLPTFNSTTIEMFIPNIPGLSEHFIYSNDDMYPIKPLTKEDFFTDDGKIKINFTETDIRANSKQFRKVCLNCYQHVLTALNKPINDRYIYLKPAHSMTAMTLSGCKKCLAALSSYIPQNIGAFRTEFQHNQYIYPLYEYFTENAVPSEINFKYTSMKKTKEILDLILLHSRYQMICLNDVHLSDREKIDKNWLLEQFEKILRK